MITPDTKDWTWVLDRPCPECGFVASDVDVARAGDEVRANAAQWEAVLDGPDPARRPDPTTWSPLEYACHVRDVHEVFAERLALVLAPAAAGTEPTFADWDQDATAAERRYDRADPVEVRAELRARAEQVAATYDEVAAGDPALGARRARRSNGSTFTLDTLTRYHLHDVVHHVWDVRGATGR